MTYNVHQHWDPLKVCIVGRSYNPEFYSFITNSRARTVMERIAIETEEDYQKLIKLLESFGVEVLRPNISDDHNMYTGAINKMRMPPMTPRDYSIMLGDKFYFNAVCGLALVTKNWNKFRGESWPMNPPKNNEELSALPEFIKNELEFFLKVKFEQILADSNTSTFIPNYEEIEAFTWGTVLDQISKHNNIYNIVPSYLSGINSASSTRVGRDIYLGTQIYEQDLSTEMSMLHKNFPQYRWHKVDTGGHSDGCFCPVKPGLIVSLNNISVYSETFPDWEVVYLPGQSWDKVRPFLNLKQKNQGKWWVPGEELNDDFTNFVESWLGHWVGYVEETVFDVNMLVIDEKNVVCNNYNEEVFAAFDRHGITPHVVNFRHRYFWDGGLHCITSDVHREGTMKDYFPARG